MESVFAIARNRLIVGPAIEFSMNFRIRRQFCESARHVERHVIGVEVILIDVNIGSEDCVAFDFYARHCFNGCHQYHPKPT